MYRNIFRVFLAVILIFPVAACDQTESSSTTAPALVNLNINCSVEGLRADQLTCSNDGFIIGDDIRLEFSVTNKPTFTVSGNGQATFDFTRECNTQANTAGLEVVAQVIAYVDGDIFGPSTDNYTMCSEGLVQ